MKTALIISEYNPFHLGHKYQIEDIRKNFGEDTAIISLMSGNFTQRGEFAIFDKYTRAKCAVSEGANLVLLLPFPYSSSSAEFFASAGVAIANKIGIVDILAFGSECGDIELLTDIAKNMLSDKFTKRQKELTADEASKDIGYPQLCEKIYKELFGNKISSSFFAPNNILAIEYIKAILNTKSSIIPYTTKRIGAGYNDEEISDSIIQSASAIRKLIFENSNSALEYVPIASREILKEDLNLNKAPCDSEKLSSAILSHFCLNSQFAECNIHDASGGLYNRLASLSRKATSIKHLTELAATKKYTSARIRRAIWFSFFGVTSSDVRTPPEYTQVLAMDSCGRTLLKRIKKTTDYPIITKSSSYSELNEVAVKQKELADKADFVFELARPSAFPPDTALKISPFVKKDN